MATWSTPGDRGADPLISAVARTRLDRCQATDPVDADCAETVELLHAYAVLVVSVSTPNARILASARTCARTPCGDDLDGLLTVRETDAGRR
jgi:hypothetical protein